MTAWAQNLFRAVPQISSKSNLVISLGSNVFSWQSQFLNMSSVTMP